VGLSDDNGEHLPIMGGTRSGKTTIQSALARIARRKGVKVVDILAERTPNSLNPVLPHPQTPARDRQPDGYADHGLWQVNETASRRPWVPWLALRRNDIIFSVVQECGTGTRTIELPEPYVVPANGWYWLRTDPPRIEPVDGTVPRETESSGEDTEGCTE
jgi:energy-coupling factor transporter ATP-binding protein EcfA2